MDSVRLEQFKKLIQTDRKPASIKVLADEFIQYNKDIENSPATTKTRKTHVEQFATFCLNVGLEDITFLTNQFIDQYFVEYRKSHSEGTTNTGKRILRVFLNWVQTYKEIPVRFNADFIHSKKMKYKTPKAIDPNIIRQVISTAEEQNKLIISLLIETGIRVSELASIKVSDIHDQEIDIHGKGAVDRTIELTNRLSLAVMTYITRYCLYPTNYLFTNRAQFAGLPMKAKTIWRRVKAEFAKYDVPATPHMLRHSFAINLLQNGCDIMTIKDLLGHEYITTTQQYLRLTDMQRKENYNKHIGKSFYS